MTKNDLRAAPLQGLLATTLVLTALLPGAAHAQRQAGATPDPSSISVMMTPDGPFKLVGRPAPATGPMHPAPSPLQSVKGLTALMANINAAKKRKAAEQAVRIALATSKGLPLSDEDAEAVANKARGVVDDDDDGDDAGEYLGAYLQAYQIRAFPYDKIDSAAYGRAIAHRALMAPTKVNSGSATSLGASGVTSKPALPNPTPVTPTTPATPIGGVTPTGGASGAANSGPWTFIGPNNTPVPYVTYFGPVGSIVTGRVNGLAFDPTTAGTAYLVSPGGGVWKTTNYGVNWVVLSDGPAFAHLQASSVAVNPTNGRNILVGMGDYDGEDGFGYSVGLMRSFDGGNTWSNVGNAQMGGTAVSGLIFDPDNPQIVTATSGRGSVPGQIWRSTDGGSTWSQVTGDPAGDWSSLTVGILDSAGNRAYYATRELDGVYKSTDRGATWTRVPLYLPYNDGFGGTVGLRARASVADANTAYVADGAVIASGAGDGRIFKTTNGGANWTDITGTYFDGAGYNDLNQLVNQPGINWSQCWYDLPVTTASIPFTSGGVTTKIDELFVGGITISGVVGPASNLWTDIGQTEQQQGVATTHSDQHAMSIDPTSPNRALYGNDGGVYGMTYNPTSPTAGTWDPRTWLGVSGGAEVLNKTLGLTQIYHADFSLSNTSVMISGTQDNSSPASFGNLSQWQNPGAGDGAGCAINPSNQNNQYCSSQEQSILLTNNLWVSEQNITALAPTDANGNPFLGDTLPFIGNLAISPVSNNLMFAGTNYLWMWNNATRAWTSHIGGTALAGTGATVVAIAPAYANASGSNAAQGAPSNAGFVYVSTSDGKLWMSVNASAVDTNGNTTAKWVEIDSPTNGLPLPKRVVTGINVNPFNPYDILVSLSGTGSDHVYRCADTSNAPVLTYTDQSGVAGTSNLPDIPINDITRDPINTNNVFYVGTDIGVFSTIDGGSTWQNMTEPLGLPNAQVNVIKIPAGTVNKTTGVITETNPYLYAGTYGRGMWRIPLSSISTPTLTAATLSVTSGLARVNGVLEMSIVVTNTSGSLGTAATNVEVATATVTAAGTATSASGLPLVIGTLPAGESVTVTVTFPATVPPSGTVATVTGTVTSTGGTVSIPSKTVRLP